MSKPFLGTVIVLMFCIACTIHWHCCLIVDHYELLHEGDKACMEVLCDQIDERDAALSYDRVLISQYQEVSMYLRRRAADLEQYIQDNNLPLPRTK